MKKKQNRKGFTLAELLIVVAIIGVLVAISIPIFSSQLEKAREATDAANIRSQYAQVMAEAITDGGDVDGRKMFGAVELKQQKDQWQSTGLGKNLESVYNKVDGKCPQAGGTAWVEYKDDQVILHYEAGNGSGSGNPGSTGGNTGGGNSGSTGGNTGGGNSGSTGGNSGSSGGNSGSSGNTGGSSGGSSSGSGTSTDPDGINPSTNLPNAFNSSQEDWTKVTENRDSYTVVPGMVYSYQGKTYFGTRGDTINEWWEKNGTPETFTGWYVLAQYTGKVWSIADFSSERNDLNRGDICKFGSDYYVFKDGGGTSRGPEYQPDQWVKLILK
jgi:prepilin-type N-terminal cleavage/methylation domain-containing protein